MKKEFSLSNDNVMINFTAKYCNSPEKLLESTGFRRVFNSYLKKIKKKNSNIYKYLIQNASTENEDLDVFMIHLFKLLSVLNVNEIINLNTKYSSLITSRGTFVDFIEDFYSFWRKLERYTIIHNNKINEGLEKTSFLEANNDFSMLILNLYRKIEENVLGYKPMVYRQLPAGGNAGLIVNNAYWPIPSGYELLKDVPFIESIMLDLPYISYPKKNTRDGIFQECFENPLKNCTISTDHWFCYPAKVGTLLAFIYVHRDFMAHAITLCNLFEMAREKEYRGIKPDIVFVFGGKDSATAKALSSKVKTVFYDDIENNIMLGYISYGEEIDYFGYVKKMALTLHNLIMIKRGYLPIHGAMVNIVMNNGKSANVVIMGDSGAGKSECLEAFRSLSEDYISDMTIVFDDMGVVTLNSSNKPLGFGTEIGAFVRLDDLDAGYAFKEIDRSIFMNPDKINARLVMPVASYKDIIKGYPIDLFLYANNYEEVKEGNEEINFFTNPKDAIAVCKRGARMAKGTTTELGLVTSYFANPFGPVQKQELVDVLIDQYFEEFFKTGVKVGQIRTSLGVKGQEQDGPKKAAKKLFDLIIK
ncbi:phosphoenolpyruvate carboxykinase [Clostridium bowmanii]|uniref:phosphoenolpyruvate carboxykinase n=1 Tax=Clostridium bowmanii TaxID=132925 RepID=UPI001C0C613C|nr:phosphoenolpyruvate carboxykinase [Clostridium bowmanii]MBU3189464.1 phosphoenolpyruvate carboxykinase [Clostridium bowmanii]MCA1074079.1 phosphoenolpyruvate carboxykinase [Clostridium bowmanii]